MTEERAEYALTPHRPQLVSNFDEATRAARAMATSGYFSDAGEVAQAMVKILAGHEMGFGTFASMTGIHIIKGKPTIGANLMAAAVKNHPRYDYRVTQMDDDAVSVAFYQGGDKLGVSTFTMGDAKDAGLVGRDNWRKYTRNMLFARAIRWYCPDVFAGNAVYTPDEVGAAVDAEGDVIDGAVVERETAPPEPPKPQEPDIEAEAEEAAEVETGGNGNQKATQSHDGRTEFWSVYWDEAASKGVPQGYAANIAKKYGEGDDGDWGKAISRLYDAVAEKAD